MQKWAGILILLGSVIFMVATFTPTMMGFFSPSDEAEKLAVLQNQPLGWNIGNLLFAIGVLVATIWVVLLVRHIQRLTNDPVVPRPRTPMLHWLLQALCCGEH